MNCPCQSGLQLEACCGRFISYRQHAENALLLMRSRYTAFALGEADYLRDSWHADSRPQNLPLDSQQAWLGLEVLAFNDGADEATVEFEARYLYHGKVDGLRENSRFVFQQDRWWYCDGMMLPLTFSPWKPGRNEACPCGSGRKFKRCCGR